MRFIIILGFILLIHPIHAQTGNWGERISVGSSLGFLSGFTGISMRYWSDSWGLQATFFPLIRYEFNDHDSEGFWMAGVQYMQPLSQWKSQRHEPGGYRQTVAYPFSALTVGRFQSITTAICGAGFGAETRWRHVRLSSSVGVGYFAFVESHQPIEWAVFPTLDIALHVGIL